MRYHVDGRLVDAESATLPVDDRGVTLGDAASEPVRVVGGTPVAWRRHVDRLFDACDTLGFDPGVDAADLRSRVEATVDANGHSDALVRLSITRGRGSATHPPRIDAGRLRPPADPDPTVVVTAAPLPNDRGAVRLQTVRTRAIPPASVPSAAATHHRLDAVRAQAELRDAAPPDGDPADEALLLDDDGHVVGGTASDPAFVTDDAIRLPALGDRTARTATRSVVCGLAHAEDLPVVEGTYTPSDLREGAEAFVAEPTAGVRPVERIDGVAVGGGPVTELLARLFEDRIVDEVP
ncbi:aminotransferase class IV [Haloplanus salilacus]|uniref:aminotransferase class IV n=1 Tax=Haloplanus salilacus TaxID=2949994 RepID=UPI0030CF1B76